MLNLFVWQLTIVIVIRHTTTHMEEICPLSVHKQYWNPASIVYG